MDGDVGVVEAGEPEQLEPLEGVAQRGAAAAVVSEAEAASDVFTVEAELLAGVQDGRGGAQEQDRAGAESGGPDPLDVGGAGIEPGSGSGRG